MNENVDSKLDFWEIPNKKCQYPSVNKLGFNETIHSLRTNDPFDEIWFDFFVRELFNTLIL